MTDEEIVARFESLRKEVERHIRVHDMYIRGQSDALRVVFNETLGSLSPPQQKQLLERIEKFAKIYEEGPHAMVGGDPANDKHAEGAGLVFRSVLSFWGDEGTEPRRPLLTVIDGGVET